MSRGKPYVALTPTLEVAQSNHDVKLLQALVQFFGYLKSKYDFYDIEAAKNSRIVNRFVINQHNVVTEFFDKYPLYTRKNLDYLDWKKLIELKASRAHDTPEGLIMMRNIKASMNKGRS
jgi:LAGLIDADG endonuclease